MFFTLYLNNVRTKTDYLHTKYHPFILTLRYSLSLDTLLGDIVYWDLTRKEGRMEVWVWTTTSMVLT